MSNSGKVILFSPILNHRNNVGANTKHPKSDTPDLTLRSIRYSLYHYDGGHSDKSVYEFPGAVPEVLLTLRDELLYNA